MEFMIFAAMYAMLLAFIGFVCGVGYGSGNIRKKAIQAGVAEYHCDPKTGVSEFRFLSLTQEKDGG